MQTLLNGESYFTFHLKNGWDLNPNLPGAIVYGEGVWGGTYLPKKASESEEVKKKKTPGCTHGAWESNPGPLAC